MKIITPLALVLLIALAAGCRQQTAAPTPAAALQIELTVDPAPPATGEAALIVTVKDSSGAPVTGAAISARGDMAHAGMAPVLADATEGENGQYRVPFRWTMGGDWLVDITVTLPDGTSATQRFDLTVES